MSKIDPTLAREAKASPDETFRVIVRVQGELDACQEQLEAAGFTIKRRLRLIRGFSAAVQGAALRTVMDQEWILSIERDAPVHTMKKTDQKSD